MKFVDLNKTYKFKLNGSINNFIVKEITFKIDITADKVYRRWLNHCTEKVNNKLYYISGGLLLDEYELDEELLFDISEKFNDRVQRRIVKVEEILKNEKKDATDKQLKYANEMYFKINKIEDYYKENELSKKEMIGIINSLKHKYDKIKYEEFIEMQEGKNTVIDLNSYRNNK